MATITLELGGLTWDGQLSTSASKCRTPLIPTLSEVVFDDTVYRINVSAFNDDGSLSSETASTGTFTEGSPYAVSYTAPKAIIQFSRLNAYPITEEDLAHLESTTIVTYAGGEHPVDPPVEPEKEISSAKSGNWSDSTTWVGGVVPIETTIVTIEAGHTVAVDTDVINYGGLHNKGTLVINDAVSLTLGKVDPKTFGTFNIYANSVTQSEGSGKILFVGGTMQTVDTTASARAKFSCTILNAVDGSKATKIYTKFHFVDFYGNANQTTGMSLSFFWSATGTAEGVFTHGISEVDILHCTFTDIKGLRDTSGNKMSPYCALRYGEAGWTGTGAFKVSVKNCDFRNVDTVFINGICDSSVTNWDFSENTLESSLADVSTKMFALNNGISSGVPINVHNNAYKDVYVSTVGNYGWGSVSNATVLLHCEHNLDFRTGITGGTNQSFGNTNVNSTLKNGLSFFSETTDNPHVVSCYTVDGYISETYPSTSVETNHYMAGCRNISNSIAIGDGDFFNFVGSWGGTENKEYSITNNTLVNTRDASADTFSSILLAENITAYNNPNVSIKNNLTYKKYGGLLGSYVRTNMEAAEPLVVTLTNNASGNAGITWANSSYSLLGDQSTNIVENPNFVDDTRGLRTATSNFLGYTGDVSENALVVPYLLSNGYDNSGSTPTQTASNATNYISRFDEVVAWIKEGYAPQSSILATAGEGGTYVGAVMPKSSAETSDLSMIVVPTSLQVGNSVTYTVTLSKSLSTSVNVTITSGGVEKSAIIASGDLSASVTFVMDIVGTIAAIASTDNTNVTYVSGVVNVVVEDTPPPPTGGRDYALNVNYIDAENIALNNINGVTGSLQVTLTYAKG